MKARLLTLLPVALIAAGAFYGFSRPVPTATATQSLPSVPEAVEFVGTTDVKFKQPINNTWYICGQLTLSPGTYRLSGRAAIYSSRTKKDTGTVSAIMVLTTDTSAPWSDTYPGDKRLVSFVREGGNLRVMVATETVEEVVALSSPVTYYLAIAQSEGGNWDSLQCLGAAVSPTIIRAERLS